MKLLAYFFLLLGCPVWAVAQSASLSGVDSAQLVRQIGAELETAPVPVLLQFKEDESKLREFVIGRLQDIKLAAYARSKGLDQRADVIAHLGSMEREALVRVAMADYLDAEREKLPDLEAIAKQRYLADSSNYMHPEMLRVAHILISSDVEKNTDEEIAEQRALAESLRARVLQGEDFSALARQYSQDKGSAENGGELPRPAVKGTFVPPFEKAAWALKPGEVSEIVRSRFGFHVIKVLEVIPPRTKSFEEVKAEVITALQEKLLTPKKVEFADSFRDSEAEAKADELVPTMRERVTSKLASKQAK